MCIALPMTTVKSFSSREAPREAPEVRVSDILVSLSVGQLELAENLLARFSKSWFQRHFDQESEEPAKLEFDQLVHPTWVMQESLTVLPDAIDVDVLECMLERLLQRMFASVNEEVVDVQMRVGGAWPVLLDALYIRIHDLGNGFFNFVFKQKYSVGTSSPDKTWRAFAEEPNVG